MARKPVGSIRKLITRLMVTGSLLGLYATGVLATSGLLLGAGMSTAMAQRGRGRGAPVPRGRGRGRGNGIGLGVGIGVGIVGGMIAAESARQAAAEEAAIESCMRRFRSYNPETRTYIGRGGRPMPCP